MKFVVHCQSSGPASAKPGQKIVSSKFAPDVTTQVAQEANKAAFTNGIPGIVLQLGNLIESVADEFEAGELYEVTIKKVETPSA